MAETLARQPRLSPAGVPLQGEAPENANAYRVRNTIRAWIDRSWLDLAVLLPVLAVCAWIRFTNLGGSLGVWNEDEGTYTAQAWAVLHGELAHYTYWYDHPPFGWIQFAGWFWLTDALGRNDLSVLAARELVAVYAVIGGALAYVLCRRLGCVRWTSVLSVPLLMITPIMLSWGRLGFLDNLALTWVLAALVVARSPRKSSLAGISAGVLLAGAVLTKETTGLFLPVVMLMLWQNTDISVRTKVLFQSFFLFLIACFFTYGLMATLKGELFPGEGHVSLIGSLQWQLTGRDSSGNIFDTQSESNSVITDWFSLDWHLFVLGILLAFFAVLRRNALPLVFALCIHLLMMFRNGYVPMPFSLVFVSIDAVIVAVGLDVMWRWTSWRRMLTVSMLTTVLLLVLLLATPRWVASVKRAVTVDDLTPMRSAVALIEQDSPPEDGKLILTDDYIWLDLVLRGYDRKNVEWCWKVDPDPAVVTRLVERAGDEPVWQQFSMVGMSGALVGDNQTAEWYGCVTDSNPTVMDIMSHGRKLLQQGPEDSTAIFTVREVSE